VAQESAGRLDSLLTMPDASRRAGSFDWSRLQPVVGDLARVSIPFRIRPDARIGPPTLKSGAKILLTLVGLVILLQMFVLSRPTTYPRLRGYEIGGIFVGIFLVFRSLYRWAACLAVDLTTFTYTILPGVRRRIPRTAIAGVVLRLVDTSTPFSPITRSKRLLLIAHDGRCIFRMDAKYFDYPDAYHLAAALEVPIDAAWDYPVEREALRSEIPGTIYWPELHITMLSIVGTLAAIAVVIIGAILGQGPRHPG
jgi:hypothetical protein